MKASVASFQFTGSRHDFHHSVHSAPTFHSSCLDANGSMQLAQRRCVVVEVDPRAPAPQFTADRNEAEIVGAEVVFVEDLGPKHEGVGTVETPAPAVERADEAATGSATLHDLHPAMATGVVEGANIVVVEPDDDDGLVEDFVLHEVPARGDLLEPARHLPHAGPEQFGLERVELFVVIALFGDPVHSLDRPRNGKGRPVHEVVS
jgi:hypothetical protein